LIYDDVLVRRREATVSDPGTRADEAWMTEALAEAQRAAAIGEVPVGAVVVLDGAIIGRGHNRRECDGNPLAHAEMLALEEAAARIPGWRLLGSSLFVTLEPCAMCAGALVNARVERLVFGARDPKAGFCGSLGDLVRDPRLNHRLEVVEGVLAERSSALLKSFFAELRRRGREGRVKDSR
jgi:tRNA(adenine34) deaminase